MANSRPIFLFIFTQLLLIPITLEAQTSLCHDESYKVEWCGNSNKDPAYGFIEGQVKRDCGTCPIIIKRKQQAFDKTCFTLTCDHSKAPPKPRPRPADFPDPLPTPRLGNVSDSLSYEIEWDIDFSISIYSLQERINDGKWQTVRPNRETEFKAINKKSGTYYYRAYGLDVYSYPPKPVFSKALVITVPLPASPKNPSLEEGEIAYTYDALGRLTYVKDNINGNRDYDYDAAGNRTEITKGRAE